MRLEDSLVDEDGGIRIPFAAKTAHKCVLPDADTNKLLAYRTGCCNTWYRRYFHNEDYATGYRWSRMGNWRVKRWQKKGWLPK